MFFDRFQFIRGVTDRLFPGDGRKGVTFVVADHRLGQARGEESGIVQKIPAVKTFQAQRTLVRDAIGGFGADNTIVFDNEV
ncbi:hypothetical protein D3C80_1089040 [compost metagenome]